MIEEIEKSMYHLKCYFISVFMLSSQNGKLFEDDNFNLKKNFTFSTG